MKKCTTIVENFKKKLTKENHNEYLSPFCFFNYNKTKKNNEKISFLAGLLTISIIVSGAMIKKNIIKYKEEKNNTSNEIVNNENELNIVENLSELDEILNYETVTKEQVINVINNNNGIPDDYKVYAIELLEYITSKYPKTDMRIFYENMKDIKIYVEEDFDNSKNIRAYYNYKYNVIKIKEERKNSKDTIMHELTHSYYSWYESNNIRTDIVGYSLNEAMTNKIIEDLVDTSSYKLFGKVLDYLLSDIPYSYYDYENGRIDKLIKVLKNEYPNIDIDYIVSALDTIDDSLSTTEEIINIEDDLFLLANLFKISMENYDDDNIYKSFAKFIKLINYEEHSKLANSFLEEYNEFLLRKGINKSRLIYSVDEIVEINKFNKEIEEFKKYLFSIDLSTLSVENLYNPLKNYCIINLSKYKLKSSLDLFYEILDNYNEILYYNYNGSNSNNIVSSKELENAIRIYQKVKGYLKIGNEIIPIVNIEIDKEEYKTYYKLLNSYNGLSYIEPSSNIECVIDLDVVNYDIFFIIDSIKENKFNTQEFWIKRFNVDIEKEEVLEKRLIKKKEVD